MVKAIPLSGRRILVAPADAPLPRVSVMLQDYEPELIAASPGELARVEATLQATPEPIYVWANAVGSLYGTNKAPKTQANRLTDMRLAEPDPAPRRRRITLED